MVQSYYTSGDSRTEEYLPYGSGVQFSNMVDDKGYLAQAVIFCCSTDYAWTILY